jgi:hypothetical protein
MHYFSQLSSVTLGPVIELPDEIVTSDQLFHIVSLKENKEQNFGKIKHALFESDKKQKRQQLQWAFINSSKYFIKIAQLFTVSNYLADSISRLQGAACDVENTRLLSLVHTNIQKTDPFFASVQFFAVRPIF